MKKTDKFAFLKSLDYTYRLKNEEREWTKEREYELWYKGEINKIIYYYKSRQNRRSDVTGYWTPSFLEIAPTGNSSNIGGALKMNNFTIYHDPAANIVSTAMSNLLFSTTPTFTFDSGSQSRNKQYEETFDYIIKENNLGSLLQKAGEYESYSGAVAFKPILDPDFSDVPILQVYPKEDLIVHKKYDKVISIVFKDVIKGTDEHNKESEYVLLSEYGRGYIKYKLVDSRENTETDLSKFPELEGLEDLYFVDENGELLDIMMAVYKENKPGARSDYENCIDDFQALDEVYSNMMNFIRKSAPKRVVSEGTLKKNKDSLPIYPNSYDQDVIVNWDSSPEEEKPVNELQTNSDIQTSIEGYLKSIGEIRKNIARTVRLSIKTITGEEDGGANQSEQALIIRENQDYKTRDNKLISWNEKSKELSKLLMILTTAQYTGNKVRVNTLDKLDVLVEFYNPAKPTFNQVAQEVQFLQVNNLLDEWNALLRLWVEQNLKSEDEVREMFYNLYGVYPENIDELRQKQELEDNTPDEEENAGESELEASESKSEEE